MNVFIQRQAEDYQWVIADNNGVQRIEQGDADALALFYQAQNSIKNWILVLPALDVFLKTLHFSDKERRHIRKAVPFLLEDEILTDIDDLHLVYGRLQKNSIDVVGVDKTLLAQHLQPLRACGVAISHCMPSYQLLMDNADAWKIYFYNQEFIIQIENQSALTFRPEHAALALELLTAQYAELPTQILLLVDDEQAAQQAETYIPSALHHLIQVSIEPQAQRWQRHFADKSIAAWNLLQGSFAKKQQWLVALKPWRWTIAVLVAACLLNSTLLFIDYQQQKQRYATLQQQISTVFRQAFAQGQMVDPRRQVERLLTSLQGGNSQQTFTT